MKDIIAKCSLFKDNRSNPSVTERGKTFQIDNAQKKSTIGCYKIDGCVFSNKDGIKCDFLFEVEEDKKLLYVELKGSDVIHAIKQVISTIEQTKAFYKEYSISARIIVGQRVPQSVSNRNEYERLRKLVNGNIIIKHDNVYREVI